MSSAREVRAMVASMERAMQQLRSLENEGERKKSRTNLEEDVTDARAMVKVAKHLGVDVARLGKKIAAAKGFLKKGERASLEEI